MRSFYKGLRLAGWIMLYVLHALAGKWMIRDETARRRFYLRNLSRYAKRALRVLDVRVEHQGHAPNPFAERNFLVVSNHLSYLDILCLSAIHPCLFVTSVDMGETPFLGKLAELGGSLFVERRHRNRVQQDLRALSHALQKGFNVVLYPEGTSSNGEVVLPFKKSLLMAAKEAGVPLLPMTIQYVEIDGKPFGKANRDTVCWYGEMAFAPHLLQLLKCDSIHARLTWLDPIETRPDSTRETLSDAAYSVITQHYCSGLPQPR